MELFESASQIIAPFALPYQLLRWTGAKSFPFEQPHPFLIPRDCLVPGANRFRQILVDGGCQLRRSRGEFAVKNFAIEIFLGAEAVKEHPLIDASAPRNCIASRSGETMCRKFRQGSRKNSLARTLQIADRLQQSLRSHCP